MKRGIPIDQELHLQVKTLSVVHSTTISQIVAAQVTEWLDNPKTPSVEFRGNRNKTVFVPGELHRELKLQCAKNEYLITDVVDSALRGWVAKNNGGG